MMEVAGRGEKLLSTVDLEPQLFAMGVQELWASILFAGKTIKRQNMCEVPNLVSLICSKNLP